MFGWVETLPGSHVKGLIPSDRKIKKTTQTVPLAPPTDAYACEYHNFLAPA